MKTLVTGASGYIGLHVVKALLQSGHQVTAITRVKEKMGPLQQEAGLKIVEADLEDTSWYNEVIEGHQCCIHAALIWGDQKSEIEGRDASISAKFFDSLGVAKIQRAIYLSSLAVHRPSIGLVTEQHGFSTTSLYGATKAAGELFFRAACNRHGISGVVVRPGPVIGRAAYGGAPIRTPQRLEQLVDLARRNLPINVSSGSKVQFCDIHALTEMIVKLSCLQDSQPTYLCVDKKLFSWADIAQHVVDALSSKSEVTVDAEDENEPHIYFQSEYAARLLDEMPDLKVSLSKHISALLDI